MRTIQRLFLRAYALTILAGGAALSAASGCGIIAAETDCNSACSLYKDCGVLPTSASCGGYCAALVPGTVIAGCGDEFDAQNQCAKDNGVCSTAATACVAPIEALGACMATFCKKTPSAQGCSVVTLQGNDGGT
jgi:hypothetical protein